MPGLLERVRISLAETMDGQRKSLSAAVPIPQWMKSKMNNRFDLDQSAFSPTEMDDPFMYVNRIRPNASANPQGPGNEALSTVAAQFAPGRGDNTAQFAPERGDTAQRDFSQYTPSCRKYLERAESNGAQKVVIAPSSSKKLKSCGVDDGFKGEAAKCGSSILKVAHDMVAGRVVRGFRIQKDDYDPLTEGFVPSARRGSKSLPASPITSPRTSPKACRRSRFFTPPYVDTESGKEGWVLSTLLAQRDKSCSLDVIAEKGEEGVKRGASTVNLKVGPSPGGAGGASTPRKLLLDPSEMRELNCWSPTSM